MSAPIRKPAAAALWILLAACATQSTTPAAPMSPATGGMAAIEMPQEKLNALTSEQRSFLRGTEPLQVVGSRERLIQELGSRNPEQVRQYVTDMMTALDAFAYDPERDLGDIPMNPAATGFNSWKIVRPEALRDRRRAAGPFSVSRYLQQRGGVPTFAGALVAITPEDLVAGKVDVAIAGIPQSMSSGARDARNGPRALRAMGGIADRNVHTLVDPAAVLNIVDYGDFAVDRMSIEVSLDHIRQMVYDLAKTGAVPFLVGGDHSVMYPTVKAVREVNPARALTVVHLGAHYNAERTSAHPLSDRDAVYRLMAEDVIEGRNLIQVGLRGPQPTRESFLWLREQGVRYHTMAEVELRGWQAVMERVVNEAKQAGNPVYISFDVSVLDPSQASGIGRAVPGGLTVRELQPLVRRICAETQIAGFELMDLAPMLDLSYVSAMSANSMLNACLTGMAMRKVGLTEENYLDPLAVDHGQPTP
jgi:guanidinobutyrase